MKLYQSVYEKKDVEDVVQSLGLGTDGTILLPWVMDEYLLQDGKGNALGLVFENEEGGITVTDLSTNVIGMSNNNGADGITITNKLNGESYTAVRNINGGNNVYDDEMNMTFVSHENIFGGKEFFSSDFELIGRTANSMGRTEFSKANVNLEKDFSFNTADDMGSLADSLADTDSLFSILDIL